MSLLQDKIGCSDDEKQLVKDSVCRKFIYEKLYINDGNYKGPLKDSITTSDIDDALTAIQSSIDGVSSNYPN